jgi:hypothetical protein
MAAAAFGLLAPPAFRFAVRTYEADVQRARQLTDEPTSTPIADPIRVATLEPDPCRIDNLATLFVVAPFPSIVLWIMTLSRTWESR